MMLLREYLRILLPLLLGFAVYHAMLVPLLEPAKRAPSSPTQWIASSIPDRENWWDEFFLPNAWQRTTCRVVKTEGAILLFRESIQKTERRWLVKPLTILIPQKDSGNRKRAIFIENPEGAEIQFKSAVDWTKELPPLENGKLLGDILLYSPPEDPAKDNGMRIETKDLLIDNREITSNQAIKMQLGNSQIEGRQLTIRLDKDLLSAEQPGQKNETPFNGLDSMELFYVDRVHVGLNPGGLWPNKDDANALSRNAYASLSCQGAFTFEFHQSLATLKNGVHMEQIVQGLPVDTFDCQELKLRVGWEEKPAVASTAPAGDNPSKGSSNWKIEQIDAIGTIGKNSKDNSGWLKLNAPGMQTEAQGQHLFMDLVNGEVRLSNHLPGSPPKDPSPVYLRRETIQVWAQEVTYLNAQAIASSADTANQISKTDVSRRLGAMSAIGAGRAQMDNHGESWTLFWGKRLFIRPDGDKDLVLIEGSANISNPTQGRFISEQLHLWLTPMTESLASQVAHHFAGGKVPFAIPDRMKAEGDVVVDSPQLKARVETMQVWFSYPPNSQVSEQVGASIIPNNMAGVASMSAPQNLSVPQGNLRLGPSTGAPPPPLSQPANSPRIDPNANRLTASPASPLDVSARFMQARVTSVGRTTRIDDLNLEGSFKLTKEQVSDTSPWPFEARGDRLRLSQTSAETSDIVIVGQPAKVAVGTGWVVAPELQLKQSENLFWIDHPGEMVIPVEALQKSGGPTLSPNALVSLPSSGNAGLPFGNPNSYRPKANENAIRWKDPPRLQWGQRMTFDGRSARFGGGVSIDCRMETDSTTLWHMNARADQMVVDMDQPVSIRSANNSSATPAQIAVIRLEDNVDIRAVQTDLKLKRRSTEHMRLPQLDIMVPTQTWIGHGPGELWSRRYGGSSPLVSSSAGNNNESLQCIHMTFMGRMEGAMAQRKATFYDRIEALIGPIVDWDQALDVKKVDSIQSLARNQSFLVSDQLDIFDASGLSWNQIPSATNSTSSNSAWEIDATSRVKLDSNTDSGLMTVTAERLGYVAKTDTVKIDQSLHRAASIVRTPHGSNNPDMDLQVKSAQVALKTGKIDMEITQFSGSMAPTRQPTGAPMTGPPKVQPPLQPNGNNLIPSPRDIPLWQRAK
jgi:hypothetical protein